MNKNIPYFVILPFIASCGPFLANDYFAANAMHGFFSADLFLLSLIWVLPQKAYWTKIFLSTISILYGIFLNPIVGLFLLVAIATSFISRKKKFPSIIIFLTLSLFLFITDCSNFFKDAFMMTLKSFWGVATYFWWGTILFFLVQIIYIAIIFYFSKKFLYGPNALTIKPLYTVLCITVVLSCNYFIFQIQQRQNIVEFSLNKYFAEFEKSNKFEGQNISDVYVDCEPLSEDTKNVFNIYSIKKDSSLIVPKTISILIESLGVAKDTTIAKRMIFHPFENSNISFIGILPRQSMHTQGAELEDFDFASYKDSTTIPLFKRLQKQKTESWYLHGYTGTFYERDLKYKKFGFNHLYFQDYFKAQNSTYCSYGFKGICDSSIINFIDSLIIEPSDKFIYWTTLDSHPPYPDNIELPSYSLFCKNSKTSARECIYYSLIENTLKKIATLAAQHPDYKFIIRGDHRPMATVNPDDFYYAWVPMIIIN